MCDDTALGRSFTARQRGPVIRSIFDKYVMKSNDLDKTCQFHVGFERVNRVVNFVAYNVVVLHYIVVFPSWEKLNDTVLAGWSVSSKRVPFGVVLVALLVNDRFPCYRLT